MSPSGTVAQLDPLALDSLSVAYYESQGYSQGILTCLHMVNCLEIRSFKTSWTTGFVVKTVKLSLYLTN
jgi:hypothetical protein